MKDLLCIECGLVFDGGLEACPNCGCPSEICKEVANESAQAGHAAMSFGNTCSQNLSPHPNNSVDLREHPYTRDYYPFWSLLRPPFVSNDENIKEQHRFDALNEFLLLANLCCRILLWWFLFSFVEYILLFVCALPLFGAYLGKNATDVSFQAGTIIIYVVTFGLCIFIALLNFFKLFPWAVARYWTKIHKLWRRLNQRYWISMHYAKKTGNLEDF